MLIVAGMISDSQKTVNALALAEALIPATGLCHYVYEILTATDRVCVVRVATAATRQLQPGRWLPPAKMIEDAS